MKSRGAGESGKKPGQKPKQFEGKMKKGGSVVARQKEERGFQPAGGTVLGVRNEKRKV